MNNGEEEAMSNTVWMGDLEPYMDEFFILQAFDQMGETAKQVKLIHSKFSGLPAGYCFVEFRDGPSAQKAMLRLNGKIIPNSQPPVRFKLNTNLSKDGKSRKEFSLFVGELSDDVDDFILYHAFKKRYPSCHTAKVVFDNHGLSKGFGFVRFSEETEQQKALIEMQHSSGIGKKQIRVSLATPKRQSGEGTSSTSTSQHPNYSNNPSYYGMNAKTYEEYLYYQQYYYSQYYANANAYNATAQQASESLQHEPDALEEPELTIDVAKYNKDYMEQSEEIFELLEDSRWHPMDQWNCRVPPTAR